MMPDAAAATAAGDDAIAVFPRTKARTLRFTCGAPRSARVIGDGSRALFLRSDGPEDLVTSLWMSVIDSAGDSRETLLADPRVLLADADAEDVPAEEKARRERAREGGSGIVSYSVDAAGRRVVFTINGMLFVTEIDAAGDGARTRELAAGEISGDYAPVLNPRISPDGRHVMYTTGEHLVLVDIADWAEGAASPSEADDIGIVFGVCPVDDGAENTWKIGLAEFAAGEEMDRYDGFWWSPDSTQVLFETYDESPEPTWYISDPANPDRPAGGTRYPRALTANADVHLTLLALLLDESGRCHYGAGESTEVHWDRDTYEYVAAVNWRKGHEPLILVQDRLQRNDQVLSVCPDGTVRVLEEHHNDQWIDLIAGTPAYTPDGRLVCALNDMAADTNRLTVNGRAFTPAGLQVREVLDITDDDVLCVIQRTPEIMTDVPAIWSGNAAEHDARSFDVVSISYDGEWTPQTVEAGVWTMSRGERGSIITGRTMQSAHTRMAHSCEVATPSESDAAVDAVKASVSVAVINNNAAEPGFSPNVTFTRMGERNLYTAIIAPSSGSAYANAEKLPVLMKPYGGPGFQQVVSAQSYYWDAQWWADQGFLVVTTDGRGTTGRGPKWDREIFENMKDVTLTDQVDAVNALPGAIGVLNVERAARGEASLPQADTERVCMIGWSYGGFLSALAVLDAPGTFHAACAGAPPTDWTLYDTHYTERYLGLDPDVYARNSIVADAPKLRRPLMLIHGFADDNVTIAHSLRLSQALMAAGRPHTFLPLTGITHMTNDETVAQNLLTLQRDFLYDALHMR